MRVSSQIQHEVIDFTDKIQVPPGNGVLTIFVRHTTCGLVINENEDRLKDDLLQAYTTLTEEVGWKHDKIDNNAQAHILSSILSPSISVPYEQGELQLGRWQRVMLVELDGPREREILVSATERL